MVVSERNLRRIWELKIRLNYKLVRTILIKILQCAAIVAANNGAPINMLSLFWTLSTISSWQRGGGISDFFPLRKNVSCATTNHLFVSAPYIRELAEETIYIKKEKSNEDNKYRKCRINTCSNIPSTLRIASVYKLRKKIV